MKFEIIIFIFFSLWVVLITVLELVQTFQFYKYNRKRYKRTDDQFELLLEAYRFQQELLKQQELQHKAELDDIKFKNHLLDCELTETKVQLARLQFSSRIKRRS